jgi:tRNA G18 (ribose-2'-O)-methylase SpoU
VHEVEDRLLADVGSLGHPARMICIFEISALPTRETPATGPGVSLGVHLHRVIDPGNVGTVVRACGALGPAWLSLSPGCSDPLSAKGVRASMGAVFRVPIEAGAEVPEEGRRIALVPGAERYGLPPEIVERCDATVSIPQAAEADSLNAAQAATLALYEAARQRAAATAPG